MADDSFPITPIFQFKQQGKFVLLENRQLYTVLLLLWRRLGGGAGTPDLSDLELEVESIGNELGNQQSQITSLSDTLISEINSLQAQINNIVLPSVDLVEIYSILKDMNTVAAANADAAFQIIA